MFSKAVFLFVLVLLVLSVAGCDFGDKSSDDVLIDIAEDVIDTVEQGISDTTEMVECMIIESGEFAGLLYCGDKASE